MGSFRRQCQQKTVQFSVMGLRCRMSSCPSQIMHLRPWRLQPKHGLLLYLWPDRWLRKWQHPFLGCSSVVFMCRFFCPDQLSTCPHSLAICKKCHFIRIWHLVTFVIFSTRLCLGEASVHHHSLVTVHVLQMSLLAMCHAQGILSFTRDHELL